MKTVHYILLQLVSDSPHLWGKRRGASWAPHYSLPDLARLDSRLEAHIDGLRVASEDGWLLALKELAWKEPGEVFAAAILAFESSSPAKIAEVLRVAALSPTLASGAISALGWTEYAQAAPHIRNLCTSELRSHRRIGIAAAAIHRQDPGRPLNDALTSGDPLLRARAARAAGELGRTDLVSLMHKDLKSEVPACRFWAAWSSTLLAGYSNALQILESIAASPGPFRERALHLVLRRHPLDRAHVFNQQLAHGIGGDPQSLRLSIIGNGILGDPAAIPVLIDHMANLPVARVAGEAFTMITGVDLAYRDLDRKQPEEFEAGPNEDPQDDNVDMDPDEKLPWPNSALIVKWWSDHQSEFQPGVRHLLGKPIRPEWAATVLRIGYQRQRAAAALELAILHRGSQLFEVRAPGYRQQQVLNHFSFR